MTKCNNCGQLFDGGRAGEYRRMGEWLEETE
jgi:hypothetical protein